MILSSREEKLVHVKSWSGLRGMHQRCGARGGILLDYKEMLDERTSDIVTVETCRQPAFIKADF